jgi:pyruvate formate lyase activating enzyme
LSALERGLQIGQEEGLNHIYLGNIAAHDTENTYCSGCGEQLIIRRGFSMLKNRLVAGRCPACQVSLGCYRG